MIKVTRVQRIITKISWFSDLPFFRLPFHAIYYNFGIIPTRTPVGQVLETTSCPIQHLPEPSTSNCKAASSLFLYHLYINAAIELAEMHLMWRQQLLQIFVSSFYSSLIQCLTSNRDATLKDVQDDRTFLLNSDLPFRYDFSPRTYFGLSYTILISSSSTIPIITLFDHPWTSKYPRIGPQA